MGVRKRQRRREGGRRDQYWHPLDQSHPLFSILYFHLGHGWLTCVSTGPLRITNLRKPDPLLPISYTLLYSGVSLPLRCLHFASTYSYIHVHAALTSTTASYPLAIHSFVVSHPLAQLPLSSYISIYI